MSYTQTIQTAVDVLHRGGVVAYPTEAVWGVGCDPFNSQAVERLLQLKQRDPAKGLILVAAAIEQLEPFLTGLSKQHCQTLNQYWPGPYTFLVPANKQVPDLIKGQHSSVALRVSAHPLVAELCRAFGGPIVSSSANIAGQPAPTEAKQVQSQLGDGLDYLLPGQVGDASRPSEIRDLLSGKVLRQG
ncbi:L-threonylcarbamoyladenylate synthase [Dasania sp. GY-MA-18]|uniref:Threonylcarbamoyl-AMP synthase n=1 Tax=Dasania phycosphaerae TaxID=2950436 RepID=A0A9J6RQ91_9GAMM|nr:MULTISPECIES: L-threonylcarbamoyladenylate synthase [Dasania]MCR8923861.1 L-threonylcarbamoyladenylate synthase [Dasania sp. GY-MA-18]MCZ0866295.1 L-threonylcarbamoyladenylate synthase [Dasania phycosphaerae]MCZ0870019.1 L-threonylcarbamoyladenylate synthase [Dasania phycosphaerae]